METPLNKRAQQAAQEAALAAAAAVASKLFAKLLAAIGPFVLKALIILLILALLAGFFMTFMEVTQPEEDLSLEDGVAWIATGTGEKLKYYKKYQKYGEEYGVPWNILAAIHKVETDFGKNLSVSWAGAVGHTQFMPCAWLGWEYYARKGQCDRLGNYTGPSIDFTNPKNIHGGQAVDANGDGKMDPYNVDDALAATAKRLAGDKKKTGKGWFDRGGPVWKYNPIQEYVNKVKKFAHLYAKPVTKVGTALSTSKATAYPYKNASTSGVDPWAFYIRQCTSFVAWRLNDAGIQFHNHMKGGHFGNAGNWAKNARKLGFTVNKKPAPGAVAQWNAGAFGHSSFGHVAYVTEVKGDQITIEEYNYRPFSFSRRTIPANRVSNYIHFK